MEERLYQITLVYSVSADEEKLLKHYEDPEPEDIQTAKRLLSAALTHQQVADYLMLRAAAFDLTDTAEGERLPEVLTGYGIDDHSPLQELVRTLSPEDQERLSDEDGDYAASILSEVFEAELDHIHVHRLCEEHQHLATQPESPPARQRHHKSKQRQRK